MKYPVLVAFLVLGLCTGCGRIGDPHPPIIRTPAKVTNLKAVQIQDQIILSWTNPSKYIDGTNAKDLSTVHILRNGVELASEEVKGVGSMQSFSVDVHDAIGTTPAYAVRIETKRGKKSESNEVSVVVLDVPGMVTNLTGLMDQHRIGLEWKPPELKSFFADVYIVKRADGVTFPPTSETHFEDTTVEEGKDKTYSYTVTAARGVTPPVPGPPTPPLVISAYDLNPPATPTGLQPPAVSGNGAFLNWDLNTEADIAGYWVYRSDNPSTGFMTVNAMLLTTNSFRDENYQPGSYYKVQAVDVNGNKSLQSEPVTAP